jgi:hypothetical protein
MTPDRATQIVTGAATFAGLLAECRAGYRPTVKVWPDDTQEQAEAALVLRAALREAGASMHPVLLPEEAVRVSRLTGLMVHRLQTEAALMEPRTLGAALGAGATYIEAPPDVLRALYDRIESAEFVSDAGATEAQIAFAERAQEQSRLAILAKLADALGDKAGAFRNRQAAKRAKRGR